MIKYKYKKGDLYKYTDGKGKFVTIQIVNDHIRHPTGIVVEATGHRDIGYESTGWNMDYFTKISSNRPNKITSLLNVISI